MNLRILPDHQKLFFSKKIFFYCLDWLKTCFDAFAHTSRPPETFFFKKDIFYWLDWLKTCFDAFAQTRRPPGTFFQKRYFGTFVVVKNVFWCICAYSQTTRNFFFKKDNFYWLEWLKTTRPDHQKLFFKKDILERLLWLKTCFDAFTHTSRPPKSIFQ
jgi:hypothetical protein